ncbi:MAG TPA: YkvA family protein [Xanthobacteraceae bacterium]|nr:YkvA family protein [Xanthobacteraceae bacterium]
MLKRIKQWARTIKRDVIALWIAARDPRVPWYAKALAATIAAYALSPIDLIPDFIPVLGYLDELVILPVGILLVVRLIPAPLMAEFRAQAAAIAEQPRSTTAAVIIVTIWIAVVALAGWWLWRSLAA